MVRNFTASQYNLPSADCHLLRGVGSGPAGSADGKMKWLLVRLDARGAAQVVAFGDGRRYASLMPRNGGKACSV